MTYVQADQLFISSRFIIRVSDFAFIMHRIPVTRSHKQSPATATGSFRAARTLQICNLLSGNVS